MVKDLGPTLLGVTWGFTAAASIMLGLRLYCRIKIINKFWWDDMWMSLSVVSVTLAGRPA